MRSTFTRKQAVLACALALGTFSFSAGAQDINEHGLVTSPGGAPVMSGFGLCVRSGFGPAPAWTALCHPARAVAPLANVETTVTARAVAEMPAPAAAAGATAAPTPAPAPPAAYEKVTFDANVMFDSDKSDLRPGGRQTLDAFVDRIRGLESQSVMALGYADRMGSAASNQVLSEERVNAVKAYLVSQGVAAERIRTRGWGETRPTTHAAQCQDANNQTNVACMQPDRHVFIEISGSRPVQ